jgi:hypothetical protein
LTLQIPRTDIVKIRSLWILATALSLIWFLYWIFYDIVVWSKPLVSVNWMNYAGAILSTAFILAGFQLEKLKYKAVKIKRNGQNNEQKIEERASVVKEIKDVLEEPVKIEKPMKTTKRVKRKNRIVSPTVVSLKSDGCAYNFGYLHRILEVEEIPGECLTCEKLLHCKYD